MFPSCLRSKPTVGPFRRHISASLGVQVRDVRSLVINSTVISLKTAATKVPGNVILLVFIQRRFLPLHSGVP